MYIKCINVLKNTDTYTDVAKISSSYIALSSCHIEQNGANIYQKKSVLFNLKGRFI